MSRTKGKKKEKLLTQQHNKFTKCPDPTTYANVATTTDNSTTTEHKNIGNLKSLGKSDLGSTKVHQGGGKNDNNRVTNAWIKNTALATAKIVTRNKTPIVSRPPTPIIMTNNVPNLIATIGKLIDLVTNKTQTIDGTYVMAVALHQQGISNLMTYNCLILRMILRIVSPSIKKMMPMLASLQERMFLLYKESKCIFDGSCSGVCIGKIIVTTTPSGMTWINGPMIDFASSRSDAIREPSFL